MTEDAVLYVTPSGRVLVTLPPDAEVVVLDRSTFDELVRLANRRSEPRRPPT